MCNSSGRLFRFGMEEKKFQLLVREPYKGHLHKPRIIKKTLNKKIKIKSKMCNGVIVADSVSKEMPFNENSEVEISLSNSPLHMIMFDKRAWKGLK